MPESDLPSTQPSQRSQLAARTVAFLIQGNEGYGTRRMALTLSGALRKRGWRTPFIALEDGSLASASNLAGVDVHVLNLGRIPTLDGGLIRKAQLFGAQCLYVRRAVQPITAKLREIQADALHFIWPSLEASEAPQHQRPGYQPSGKCPMTLALATPSESTDGSTKGSAGNTA